jgi:polar amino acid transport system substrate-binding protein
MRRLLPPVAGLVLVALLGACASPAPQSSAGAPPAAPRPVGVQDPAVIPSSTGGPAPTCNARASLRPAGALPDPGRMPAGSTMARIVEAGRLRVGVDQNTYLFGYRNPESGQIEGFDIDVAREMARAIFGDPDKIQLVAITSAQRIPAVNGGDATAPGVDLVADTMTMNCDRWQKVNFSSVYYEAGQRVLVNRDSTVTGIDDLGGKKVCAATGSTSIQNIAAAKSHPVAVAVADWTDCIVLLQQGQVQAMSTDDTILLGMAAQDPNLKVVGARFTEEPYGIAIGKAATDLTRFVNGVLERMRSDGRLAAINNRWLGAGAPPVPSATYQD